MTTMVDLAAEANRLSKLLDDGLEFLRDQAYEAAQAEHDYRKAVAEAWADAPSGTVPEREAFVKGLCAGARRRRDVAEGMRQAALESVRSRRQQISLLQSLAAAYRSEAEFARTGPGGGP